MAEGKWIAGLKAGTPLAEAARRTLRVRLGTVGEFLECALTKPEHDSEYVHQLRVGTRRAVAALELFAACVPHGTYRRARKRLRRLRRAAGTARDWDVFLAARRSRAGRGLLSTFALGQRAAAQQTLQAAAEQFPFGFDQFAQELVALIDEPHHTNRQLALRDLAKRLLSDLAQQFHDALTQTDAGHEQLHRVRIVGKALRYTTEIVGNAFASRLREQVYPAVETLQDILGRVNDARVALRNLEELQRWLDSSARVAWKKLRAEARDEVEYYQSRLPRDVRQFQRWRRDWNESGAAGALFALVAAGSPDRALTPRVARR